ncbi:uncharacterized protein LOC110625615 [Manihot esculenta]|uniref:uncharacterized protein LOC110625615 n=1 Tax=Manihot esculenta TaxID=3983 RepID=UPI001CC67BEA|nr:uncharacterized protein LOC110625615 [Manihot esculenta]
MESGYGRGLENHVVGYFAELYTQQDTLHTEITKCVKARVTVEHNMDLTRPLTDDEIKAAAFSMHSDKSPGDDGFNPGFYKRYWYIVGSEVISECKKWFIEGVLPEEINNTNIALASRLRSVLPNIISEMQSAFVGGRLITDNVIVANEMVHYMRGLRMGKVGYAALKLDITKAYDRLEWSYIESILVALGFDEKWINLMMICVTTVRYNILLRESIIGPIVPLRGLRQGDLLSPSLFIIGAKGLSALILKKEEVGALHGCRICERAPTVSHLLFADDSYLFFKANEAEGETIRLLLETYKQDSGQEDLLCQNLGVTEDVDSERYLGMPIMKLMNKYWWGKVRRMKWDRICESKNDGGLGFRNLRVFNLAMLAKQDWTLLVMDTCLVARVMRANIWKAKKVILRGARVRVGDGQDINVWNNSWLSNADDGKVTTQRSEENMHLRVCDLIDEQVRAWDVPKIFVVFNERDKSMCDFAKNCWSFMGLSWPVDRSGDVKEWLSSAFDTFDLDQRASVAASRWQFGRIETAWLGQLSDDSDCKWKKPNAGWTKANVDAAMLESKGAVGQCLEMTRAYLLVAIVKFSKAFLIRR